MPAQKAHRAAMDGRSAQEAPQTAAGGNQSQRCFQNRSEAVSITLPQPLNLTLPSLPPSVNASTGNRRPGQKGRGRFVRPELVAWRRSAGWSLVEQLVGVARPAIAGPVSVAIRAPWPRRRSDGDNRVKAILDLLVSIGVLADDSHEVVRGHSWRWVEPATWAGDHGCEVEIAPLPEVEAFASGETASRAPNAGRTGQSAASQVRRQRGSATRQRRAPEGPSAGSGADDVAEVVAELRGWGIAVEPEQVRRVRRLVGGDGR